MSLADICVSVVESEGCRWPCLEKKKNQTQNHSLPRTHHQMYTDSSLIDWNLFLLGSKHDFLGAIFSPPPALKPVALASLAFPGTQWSEGHVCSRYQVDLDIEKAAGSKPPRLPFCAGGIHTWVRSGAVSSYTGAEMNQTVWLVGQPPPESLLAFPAEWLASL